MKNAHRWTSALVVFSAWLVVAMATQADAQYVLDHPVVDSIEVFATDVGAPSGLALAEDGSILISDFHNPGFIRRATLNGNVTVFSDGIRSATNILVHQSGKVYSTSQDNTLEFCGPGGGEMLPFAAGFENPAGLAGDDLGNFYVVNNTTGSISRVNADGVVTPFASGFNDPVGLTADACGNLYVANRGDNSVMVVDGRGVSELYEDSIISPHSLVFGTDGNLYVTGEEGITVILATHEKVVLPGTAFEPRGLVFDDAGRLYVSCWDSNYVRRISLNSTGDMVDTVYTFAAGFSQPASLVYQPNGDLLVANFWNPGLISKVNPAGAVSVYASGGDRAVSGLARDSAGYVYGTFQDGTVKRVSPGGGILSTYIPGQLNPSGIAIDTAGNIYVVNHNINAVSVYTEAGVFLKQYASGLNGPVGCVLDSEGNLYVADRYTNSIVKISQNGTPQTFVPGVPSPHTLAFDAYGNLFVSVTGAVVMITPQMVIREVSTAFNIPVGLAFDSDGNLFVSDYGAGVVKKVVFK